MAAESNDLLLLPWADGMQLFDHSIVVAAVKKMNSRDNVGTIWHIAVRRASAILRGI